MAIKGSAGVTSIESSVAGLTVRSVDPVTPEKAAEIVVLPPFRAEARPRLPATFEIVYGHAWKPDQPARSAVDAPAVIRFERPAPRR